MDVGEGSSVVVEEENQSNAAPEVNDKNEMRVKNEEISNEPTEISENVHDEISANCETAEKVPEALPSEISTTVPETSVSQNHSDKEDCAAENLTVKEEPGSSEEIDYGMPIAKTPMHTPSFAEGYDPLQSVHGNSKSALDEYLDGMVTPIAPPLPRLRVKTELALLKPSQAAVMQEINNRGSAEICAPPPPPVLSESNNSDFVADDIATPRISIASINRLRVKSEFSTTAQHNEEDPCEEYFDGHMNRNNSEREAGEISPDGTDDASENEQIPDDYFDDLLIDKIKEKIDAAQNNDFEIKYSDRLKELERLRNELRRVQEKKERKMRKKQKKSKKRSRKRSRSRSASPHPSYYDRNKRNRMSPSRKEHYTRSNYDSRQVFEENVLTVDSGFINIKTEYSADQSDNLPLDSEQEEVEEILTPKQKKERAVKRAMDLLHYLKDKSDENSGIFFEFPFVSTVRKLPTSHSYVQQQIYENRSPLHTVNNVSYKFNSHTSRFKTEEWGLAALPPLAAKMAKLVGCDAEFIHNKLKTMKIPAKLKKAPEPEKDTEHEVEEELVETTSSLHSNAMTQTDDVDIRERKEKGYEIGVQAKPEAFSIGCQTLETQTPAANKDLRKNDELPLMKLIQDLNENQLMAIHSFAELIKEQNGSSNAMEMYKIQMQIMDIYKMSQIPSALDVAQPAIVNNYKTTAPGATARPREQSNLCIQSVKGADGRQYTVSDPRHKSASYFQRNAYDDAAKYDHRHEQHAYATRPSTSRGYSQTYFTAASEYEGRYSSISPTSRHHPYMAPSSQSPPPTVKRYGRGGIRR